MRDKRILRGAGLFVLLVLSVLVIAVMVQADEPPNPPTPPILPIPKFPGDVAIMELEPGLVVYRVYDEEMHNTCYVVVGLKGYTMGCVPPKVEAGLSATLLPLIAKASEP